MKTHRLQWDVVHDFKQTVCGVSLTTDATWDDKMTNCKNCIKKRKRGKK